MKTVDGRGTKPAPLLILGEAPARHEIDKGLPFVGPAGWELDKWLREASIPIGTWWLDNVFNFRLPNDDVKQVPQSAWTEARPRLSAMIREVNPHVIVALGETALRFFGREGVGKWRGSMWWDESYGRPTKVLATYHPAYIVRGEYRMRWVCVKDLKKAFGESLVPAEVMKNTPPTRQFIVEPSLDQVLVATERLRRGGHITLDIETYRGQISCIGLTTSPLWAICIPLMKGLDSYWSAAEEKIVWREIAPILESQPIWGQNLNFDIMWFRTHGIRAKPAFDNMHAHSCLWLELPHDQAFLTSVYTSEPFYKDEGKGEDYRPTHDLWIYNCRDAAIEDEIALELQKELRERNLWDFYVRHYASKQPYAIEMQARGVAVDVEERDKIIATITPYIENVDAELRHYAGPDFNPTSPKQRTSFLYETLKLRIKKKRKTGKPTSDEAAIRELIAETNHPALHLLSRALTLRKIVSYASSSLDDWEVPWVSYQGSDPTST